MKKYYKVLGSYQEFDSKKKAIKKAKTIQNTWVFEWERENGKYLGRCINAIWVGSKQIK